MIATFKFRAFQAKSAGAEKSMEKKDKKDKKAPRVKKDKVVKKKKRKVDHGEEEEEEIRVDDDDDEDGGGATTKMTMVDLTHGANVVVVELAAVAAVMTMMKAVAWLMLYSCICIFGSKKYAVPIFHLMLPFPGFQWMLTTIRFQPC